jgi:hypothetical protein
LWARRDAIHVGHPLIQKDVPFGTLDSVWIPWTAKHDLVVIAGQLPALFAVPAGAGDVLMGLAAFWVAGSLRFLMAGRAREQTVPSTWSGPRA